MRSQKELQEKQQHQQQQSQMNDASKDAVKGEGSPTSVVTGASFESAYDNFSELENKQIAITYNDILESYRKMKESKSHTGHTLFENRIELD